LPVRNEVTVDSFFLRRPERVLHAEQTEVAAGEQLAQGPAA
jgi:hypothetical protein